MIGVATRTTNIGEATVAMKIGKSAVHWKARALPEIRFEDQQLTSPSPGSSSFNRCSSAWDSGNNSPGASRI